MPNRILRDGLLDSDAVGQVSPGAEMLFVRLMLLADDFGRYDGRVSVICRRAFVNRRAVDEHMTGEWLAELEQAGLILAYLHLGRPYLQIDKWRQRTRAQASKFPSPDEAAQSNQQLKREFVRHKADKRPPDDRPPRTETETETETEKYPLTPLQGANADQAAEHRRSKPPPIGIRSWLKACADAGEKPIPEGGAALAYADSAGIPFEYVALHWREFKTRNAETEKRYSDWRRAFLNSLRGNWYGLWVLHADGSCALTTRGVQARKVQEALAAAAGAEATAAQPPGQGAA